MAESLDGITWTKPELHVYNWNSSRANNIVVEAEGCFTFVDTNPSAPVQEAWKMVCSNAGAQLFTSPDGIRWEKVPSAPLSFGDDTQPTAMWDATIGKYVVFVRINIGGHDAGNRRHVGRCITANLSDWESEKVGCEVVFAADETDPPNLDVYTSVHVAYPSVLHPTTHLFFPSMYSHFAVGAGPPYELGNDGLIGTRLLAAPNLSVAHLAYAADGSRSAFVDLGVNTCASSSPLVKGGWCNLTDGSLARTATDTSGTWVAPGGYIPSANGEDLFLYYAGQPYTHGSAAYTDGSFRNNTGIGLLRVRKDGFVAMESPYDFRSPAPSFTTHPIQLPGDGTGGSISSSGGNVSSLAAECAGRGQELQLVVNMITSVAGYVAVEVLAADGEPRQPGDARYAMSNADRLKGNAITAVASWSWSEGAAGKTDRISTISGWSGRSITLRVELVDAKLFSIKVRCQEGAGVNLL